MITTPYSSTQNEDIRSTLSADGKMVEIVTQKLGIAGGIQKDVDLTLQEDTFSTLAKDAHSTLAW